MTFKYDICSVDLTKSVDIVKSKFDKEARFLLHVHGIFGKYTWVTPLKDKRSFPNSNAF